MEKNTHKEKQKWNLQKSLRIFKAHFTIWKSNVYGEEMEKNY